MPTSDIIKLKNVRLSFPQLFKMRSFREGQDPRFEATFLLDPSDKAHAKIIKGVEAFGNAASDEQWPKGRPKKCIPCYGLAEDFDLDYDGYEGMYKISTSANAKNPVQVYDRGRQLLEVNANGIEPNIPYAGCYVNATITLWTQDNEYGSRINANLRLVQFAKDGDAFGAAAANAEEELDILDDDEDGDDFLED